MVWAVVCIAGLVMETSFIVVLGRRVTERFERSADPPRDRPVVRKR